MCSWGARPESGAARPGRNLEGGEDDSIWQRIGHLSRFSLIGIFLVRAAYQYDPKEAVGLDGALSEVVHTPYGPFLLALVAAGLFAFGVYSFVEASYREL